MNPECNHRWQMAGHAENGGTINVCVRCGLEYIMPPVGVMTTPSGDVDAKLDALIARLRALWDDMGFDTGDGIGPSGYILHQSEPEGKLIHEAAAALEEIRAEREFDNAAWARDADRLRAAESALATEREARAAAEAERDKAIWSRDAAHALTTARDKACDALALQLEAAQSNFESIEFSANGYCPACGGWEVTKGRGCERGVHMKTCWLLAAIAARKGTGETK